MKIHKYPDGTSYVEVDVNGTFVTTIRINTYEDLWHLTQFVDAANHNGVIPTITIPWLLDGQADRRFEDNQSSGLKLICKHLNRMNANFKIFHPHNSEAVEISIKNVEIIDNYPFILHVIYNIKDNNMDIYPVIYDDEFDETFDKSYYDSRIKDNLVILAPDAGAFKWISKLCDKLNWKGQLASASKSRKYENNQSKLIQIINEQDFNGKDVLLIDDICIKGGSAIGLAKILKTKNVRKLYAAFSHMTVDSPNPELFELFDYIYTTNSKDLSYIDTRTEGFPKNLLIIKQF